MHSPRPWTCCFASLFGTALALVLLMAPTAAQMGAANLGDSGLIEAASPTPTPTPVPIPCVGDCGNDGSVTIDDLLVMVNIALDLANVDTCSAGDADHDGRVTVDEIVMAVDNALSGCATPVPTATPANVPTPTPTRSPQTATVAVGSNGTLRFSPSELTIHVGDTVEWTWSSSGHSVVSGGNCTADGQFCSPDDRNCATAPTSVRNATYRHTFTAPGTYPYFCSPHCGLGMVGTITVQ